jgi:hypothetical protein
MFQIKSSTLLSLKNFALAAIIISLSSCGFKPLYENKEIKAGKTCGNFSIEEIKYSRIAAQKLKYNLQDSLNLACINSDKNYKVQIDLSKTSEGVGIQKDREVTRYNLRLVGSFRVLDSKGKIITSGTSNMIGGYDAVISDYGTYALEQDTESKLLEEMANDISLKIVSKLK